MTSPQAPMGDQCALKATFLNGQPDETDVAMIEIAEQAHRNSSEPSQTRGGLFSRIEFDDADSPIQRVYFDTASKVLKIYTKFPRVGSVLGDWTRKPLPDAAVNLYAELLTEGLAKAWFLRQLERGKVEYASTPEGIAQAVFAEVDGVRRRFLHQVYLHVKKTHGS